MFHSRSRSLLAMLAGLLLAVLPATGSLADGTETLGTPSIPIAAGSGIAIGGVGLQEGQPAGIDIDVPGDVVQVLLYWEGQTLEDQPFPDDTIVIEGIEVQGTQIGGPTQYTGPFITQSYRADITDLGLVGPGLNVLEVGGLDFPFSNCGAGVLVIWDDGSEAVIDLRDGNDFAFNTPDAIQFANDLQITEQQIYTFEPSDELRVARIPMFLGSVADDRDPETSQPLRPTVLVVQVGAFELRLEDLFNSLKGKFWDATSITVDIPPGVDQVGLQILSRDELGTGLLPASLVWIAGALTIEGDVPPVMEPKKKKKSKKKAKKKKSKKKKSKKKKAKNGGDSDSDSDSDKKKKKKKSKKKKAKNGGDSDSDSDSDKKKKKKSKKKKAKNGGDSDSDSDSDKKKKKKSKKKKAKNGGDSDSDSDSDKKKKKGKSGGDSDSDSDSDSDKKGGYYWRW